MARPKPKILLEITNKKTFKVDQVLVADAIWAVYYKGLPINLKTSNSISNHAGPKYKKISFSNSGHAFNLAKKLNKIFDCSDFEVYRLTSGEKVINEPKD